MLQRPGTSVGNAAIYFGAAFQAIFYILGSLGCVIHLAKDTFCANLELGRKGDGIKLLVANKRDRSISLNLFLLREKTTAGSLKKPRGQVDDVCVCVTWANCGLGYTGYVKSAIATNM